MPLERGNRGMTNDRVGDRQPATRFSEHSDPTPTVPSPPGPPSTFCWYDGISPGKLIGPYRPDLGALTAHAQDLVAVFFADVGAGGFEDPRAEWTAQENRRAHGQAG